MTYPTAMTTAKKTIAGKIIVGLSGGVDSAVSALLLKRKGYDVHALFMKNWEEDDNENYCATADDLAIAQAVAKQLDIPFRSVNFATEYWNQVFNTFLNDLRLGHTPNPDILCNREIKFRYFLDYALAQGAEKIATGHYACTQRYADHAVLKRAHDLTKDQTYFLYQVSNKALMHTLFPLCRYKKTTVREMAKAAHLPNYSRKDSTGICFIGKRPFHRFIERYCPSQPGDIINVDGKKLGQHRGLFFYTIGQRKGLGIGGVQQAENAPWFVVDKKQSDNLLIVAQGHQHPTLFASALCAQSLHWILGKPPANTFSCRAKIRYRQIDQPCSVTIKENDHCHVVFEQPMRAITPGQSIVFYQGEICLGGGIIQQGLR